jgi:hypothetical protein
LLSVPPPHEVKVIIIRAAEQAAALRFIHSFMG